MDEGPKELGNRPSEVPSIEVGPVLELMPSAETSGGTSPPTAGPAFFSSSADFFFFRTMRERRRWIFASVIVFCWTAPVSVSVVVKFVKLQHVLWGSFAFKTANALMANFDTLSVRSGTANFQLTFTTA